MMKIFPIKSVFSYNQKCAQNTFLPSFKSTDFNKYPNLSSVENNSASKMPNWIKDKTTTAALKKLEDLKFDESDVKYIQSLGMILPFLSGKEAINFINNSNTRIKFDTLASSNIHASYDFEDNFIKINQIYKNTQNPAEIMAIASAIMHEAGHAKDKDGESSIQEELNCLAMNALAHRVFSKNSQIDLNSDSLIIKEGTHLYANLFFDKDESKKALIERVKLKYGFLPAGDLNHPPSSLALNAKNAYF